MSKEDWFRRFETLEAENPGLSDDVLCEMAREAQIDERDDLEMHMDDLHDATLQEMYERDEV